MLRAPAWDPGRNHQLKTAGFPKRGNNAMKSKNEIDEETKQAILYDSAWVAGAKFGWNCGVIEDRRALHEAIEARSRDRVEALKGKD